MTFDWTTISDLSVSSKWLYIYLLILQTWQRFWSSANGYELKNSCVRHCALSVQILPKIELTGWCRLVSYTWWKIVCIYIYIHTSTCNTKLRSSENYLVHKSDILIRFLWVQMRHAWNCLCTIHVSLLPLTQVQLKRHNL